MKSSTKTKTRALDYHVRLDRPLAALAISMLTEIADTLRGGEIAPRTVARVEAVRNMLCHAAAVAS
jgi:hypothetical protein